MSSVPLSFTSLPIFTFTFDASSILYVVFVTGSIRTILPLCFTILPVNACASCVFASGPADGICGSFCCAVAAGSVAVPAAGSCGVADGVCAGSCALAGACCCGGAVAAGSCEPGCCAGAGVPNAMPTTVTAATKKTRQRKLFIGPPDPVLRRSQNFVQESCQFS